MSLRCGVVGLPGCGKTTIYNAVTAADAAAHAGAELNRTVVPVPEPRVDRLVDVYRPPKIVRASLEIVDIPGIRPGSVAGDGRGARLLGHLKSVDALVHVLRCFESGGDGDGVDPVRDAETVDLEMMVADADTLRNRIWKLGKRARGGDRDAARNVAHCEKVLAGLEDGVPARRQTLEPDEQATVRECELLTLKRVVYVANVASAADADGPDVQAVRAMAEAEQAETVMVCGLDEAEISRLNPDDRAEFLAELGMNESSMQRLLAAAQRLLGLVNFFTAGESEVHVWTCVDGDKAPAAAGRIHSDMERGFIRMEVIPYEDLVALGGEEAAVRAGLRRLEGKDYQVRDGDVVVVRFNKS